MRKFLFLIFAVAVAIAQSCSSTRDAADNKIPADQKLDDALLWKIEGKGLQTSYLFGTIHIIDEEEYFLPPGTESALDAAEVVVFEIDMDDMTDLGAQMGLLTKAFMPGGMKLRDLLEPDDYEMVKAFFTDMGLPMFMVERIKPMFLSVFASMDMSAGDLSMGSMKSYEMEFYEQAQGAGKDVRGLETMEYQMAVFDSIPYSDQADMLVQAIKYQDAGNEEMEKLIQAYKDQQIDLLAELAMASEGGLTDYEDILLKNRNENWIPVMQEMMKENIVFFAVGAGHLGGKYGVVRLLRAEGLELTPVLGAEEAQRGNKL